MDALISEAVSSSSGFIAGQAAAEGIITALNGVGQTRHQVTMPDFRIQYEQKDITHDIKPYLLNVEYTDYLGEQSDELSVSFEDTDGRWLHGWYPNQGDQIAFSLGDQFTGLVDLGYFDIADIEYQLSPAVITLKALSTGVRHSYRTHQSKSYEQTSLAGVIGMVAKRLKLKLVGAVADIKINHITQYQETDVEFLSRLARQYGHTFKIVDKTLVFMANTELARQEPVMVLNPADITSGQFQDQIKSVPDKVVVSGYDVASKTNRVVSRKTTTCRPLAGHANRTSSDTLRIVANRGESDEQLEARADAALSDAQQSQITGNLSLFGQIRLVAGQVIQLKGYGAFNGRYLVKQAHHRLDKSSGYSTELEIKMLEYIEDNSAEQEQAYAKT